MSHDGWQWRWDGAQRDDGMEQDLADSGIRMREKMMWSRFWCGDCHVVVRWYWFCELMEDVAKGAKINALLFEDQYLL